MYIGLEEDKTNEDMYTRKRRQWRRIFLYKIFYTLARILLFPKRAGEGDLRVKQLYIGKWSDEDQLFTSCL